MKNMFLIICFVVTFSASEQKEQTDQQLVNSFVKDWIKSDGSKECALKYLEIHKSYLQDEKKKKFLFDVFSTFAKTYKEAIDKNGGKYQILAHKGNEENESIKKFNLKTDDYSGVYYLVYGDKVLNSIIVKDGRIISFSVAFVHRNMGRFNIPWFINQPG